MLFQLENNFFEEKLDYIIITGDLTSNNDKESYQRLESIINKFGSSLLRKDNGEVRIKNRIIVVPGPGNYNNTLSDIDKSNFRKFCEEIGKNEIVSSLDDDYSLYVENFSDISFISVPHWGFTNGLVSEKAIDNSKFESIDSTLDSFEIDYCNSTPTVFIGEESILTDGSYDEVKRYIESLFTFSICALFDAQSNGVKFFFRNKEKYSVIGFFGVKSDEDLEAKMVFYRPYSNNTTALRIDSWQYKERLSLWKRKNQINGDVDAIIKLKIQEENLSPFRFSQVDRIIFHTASDPRVVVRGFPGSGKSEVFNYLIEDKRFLHLKLERPDVVDDIQKFISFQKENEKFSNSILLIVDTAYYKVKPDEKEDYLDKLQKLLLSLSNHSEGLVYFYSSMGTTIFDPIRKIAEKNEIVESLKEDDFKILTKQYSSHSPFDIGQVSNLTGRFPGYSRLLLDGIHTLFNEYPLRHEKISVDSCWELITSTFKAEQKLQIECYRFEEEFKRLAAGRVLFNMIVTKVRKYLSKNRIDKTNFQGVKFEVSEKHELFDEIIATAEILTEGGILAKETNNTYSTNLILPFLMEK